MTLINRYMDDHREDPTEITAKAKAEKYAKILAKTIISPEGEGSDHGQNAYFYDAAEGLLASVVFLDWGIRFEKPLEIPDRGSHPVHYAGKAELEQAILSECPLVYSEELLPPKTTVKPVPIPEKTTLKT